jgi:hypothetical protein
MISRSPVFDAADQANARPPSGRPPGWLGTRWTTTAEMFAAGNGGANMPVDVHHSIVGFNEYEFPKRVFATYEELNDVFVHEFFGHAYAFVMPELENDFTVAKIGRMKDPSIVMNNIVVKGGPAEEEAEGMYAENIYRRDHGEPPRKYYQREGDYIPSAEIQAFFDQWDRRQATKGQK